MGQKRHFGVFAAAAFATLLFFAPEASAQGASADGLAKAAANINIWAPPVMKLVHKVTLLGGIALFVYGVLKLAQVEQGKVELKTVMFKLLAASGMVGFSSAIASIEGTIGSGNEAANILGVKYEAAAGGGLRCDAMSGIMTFIKLVGLIAFARGLLLLKAHGENKDGAVGRALTHMIGGSAAMNIEWSAKMLASTIKNDAALRILCLS